MDDLNVLWKALENMFDADPAAARTGMYAQKLIVFKHDSELGNARAQTLFNLVEVKKNCGEAPPRSFSDYDVLLGGKKLEGLEVPEIVKKKVQGVQIDVKL